MTTRISCDTDDLGDMDARTARTHLLEHAHEGWTPCRARPVLRTKAFGVSFQC